MVIFTLLSPFSRSFHTKIIAILLGSVGFSGLVVGPGSASTYYIDPAGQNTSDGISPSTPWKDFTNVNATTFKPGDKILLKRGGTWNQHFQLRGSGTAQNFIEVAAYGSGSRPKIQRNRHVADRCLTTYDVSYVKISNLEVCDAGAGIVIHYDHTYHNNSVYIDDIVAHGFYGIKTNQIPNPKIPNEFLHRGTDGWEGVTGAGHGPNPERVSYWAPDDVAFSYGIGLTGAWDMANNGTTMLSDFRVTNCEIYHAGCGVALDWNNHTNRDGYFAGEVEGWRSPRNKVTDVVMDNLNIHDIDSPWVSITGIFWTGATNGVLKNSRIYKGAYFASGGTAQLHWYLSKNCLIDNVQVRTSEVPNPGTTDLSIADIGGCDGLEIRNSTFENIAGYGMGFLYDPAAAPDVSVHNINIHHNTFLNIDWHWPNIMEVFHAVGSVDNHPTGAIHHNQWIGAPDVTLVGGKTNPGDPADANWALTARYSNDVIDSVSSGQDLAEEKTITASSSQGPGNDPSRAVDSDESSAWISAASEMPQWVRVDLGAVVPINEVRIRWQSPAYAAKYEVRVSADGTSFETVHNRDLRYDLGTTRDIFTTRLARYVVVEMTGGNPKLGSTTHYAITALGVFNDENLAQGRVAVASSTSSSANFESWKGNDGDDASRWTSAVGSGPRTYLIDLGAPFPINEVKTTWGNSFAKSYSVSVATEEPHYTTVASRTGITLSSTTCDVFERIVARYIRITMTEGVAPDPVDYSIAEVRVFGARSLAQDARVSASSTMHGEGHEAQRAVDASDNTYWSSDPVAGECSFKVDLGRVQTINEVITKWGSAFAKKYKIEISSDDAVYLPVASRDGVTGAGNTRDMFAPRAARFVKLTMDEGATQGTATYAIKSVLVNNDLARGATCKASSSEATDSPDRAVDISNLTQWRSKDQKSDEWFELDLGSVQWIDQIVTEWGNPLTKNYTVELMGEGGKWEKVKTRLGVANATNTDDKLARPVSARYIRFNLITRKDSDESTYAIRSVKIYGPHP